MVETVYFKECHYVSQIIFFLCPFLVDHCMVMYKLSSIESLFRCSSHSSSSHAGVCYRSICVLRSSIRKVSLAKTYTYWDRANFETTNVLLRYLNCRLSRYCSSLCDRYSPFSSCLYMSVGSTLVLKSFIAVSNAILFIMLFSLQILNLKASIHKEKRHLNPWCC